MNVNICVKTFIMSNMITSIFYKFMKLNIFIFFSFSFVFDFHDNTITDNHSESDIILFTIISVLNFIDIYIILDSMSIIKDQPIK